MAKAGEKIKEGATWVADKILPKGTKEAVKDAARKASGVDDAIQKLRDDGNDAQADAAQKAVDEAYGKDASQIVKEAGGYDNVEQYGRDLGTKVLEEARPIDEQNRAGKFLEDEREEARKAREAAGTADLAAQDAAYQAARNTGANRAAASAISGTPQAGNITGFQAGLRSGAASSQADYLNKLGYSQALDSQASNLEKGATLNNIASFLGGAATGAKTGLSLSGVKL